MALYYGGSSACRVVCYSKIPTPQTTTKFLNQRLVDVSRDLRKNSAIRFQEMARMVGVLKHPDEIYPLLKLKKSMEEAAKQIPTQPHWAFSYSVLHNFTGLALVFQRLDNHTHLRDAMCAFYLILRTLDTIEDDLSIPTDVKGPILKEFHSHIYEPNWQFSCGSTQQQKSLVDQFHHVSTAFLELQESYQEIIVDITKRIGAGMAEYLCKEVETIDEYNEYCHYVAGLVVVGVFKLFHASGLEEYVPDYLPNAMGLFLQKVDGILDYTEDMNQLPKPRLMWPRQTWSKYVEKLEDLKCEENSVKAVQCLNDMATDALVHLDDCLKGMSSLGDPGNFMFCAFPLIKGLGNLAFCYNNIEVFRRNVKMRIGLAAKLIDRTKAMSDFYGACFDFCCMMKSKVDMSDPNATTTLDTLEAILKTCRESGQLIERKSLTL